MRADPEPPAPSEMSANGASDGRSIVIGAGPAGLTAGVHVRQARRCRRPCSRPRTRSAASPRRSSATGTGSTSAAIASSPRRRRSTRCGTRCSTTSSSCARGCRASTGTAGSSTTRCAGTDVIRKLGPVELTRASLSYMRATMRQGRRGELRGVGVEPVRPAAVRAVLPLLHREGLGRADKRDPCRVGGAADQGAVVLERRQGRVLRQPRERQEPDRGVPLPAVRPGPDVGGDDRPRSRPRAARCCSNSPVRAIAIRDGLVVRGRTPAARPTALARDLVAAAAQPGRHRRARRRRTRWCEAARGCATATS